MAKSTDFSIGQVVTCTDPERFISSVAKYLTNREGVVISVAPPDLSLEASLAHGGWINRVHVEWQKRNGRGKTQRIWMRPDDIAPKEAANG
jgi:hypothetical protein